MNRIFILLAVVSILTLPCTSFAIDKKVDIMNGAQFDIYTLKISPTNANNWEENLLQEGTLPNGDNAIVEISRTENTEAWDITVTNKDGVQTTWIGLPLDKAGQVTLLPDGKYMTTDMDNISNMKK